MSAVGVLIFVAILGAFICAKVRAPGGAVAFSLLAMVLFIATPVGQGLPEAIGSFLTAVDNASTPALNGGGQEAGVGQ
ncbi:hypothetical protein GCM10010472_30300 [Pseudonocardia halophobica]|uniref:Uncharacterized protein n=1 Tax=Pseudonocardia halophobica TaxID=29401 RepID=A0A9W6KZ42_9PSEU|nr:hypothetical protein [Pseudonocardia halophobica]GLL09289.1 hypothetical protein GCM10017577_04290 [Pseudonocardia halophobica]